MKRAQGGPGCRACAWTGWSRSHSGACDCARGPVVAPQAPLERIERPLRECAGEDCEQLTRARLCDECAAEELAAADDAFNDACGHAHIQRKSRRREARVRAGIVPAFRRSPPMTDVPETTVEYDDDARADIDRAWSELRGAREHDDEEQRAAAWTEVEGSQVRRSRGRRAA